MRHNFTLRLIDTIARAGSIRKAAESLSITSTALNRRLLAFEEELGMPIFERLPRGVRLTAAGEVVIHHARLQMSDLERVRSHLADLSGERRGHVSIACSQGLLPHFLPQQIAQYRAQHPAVTFTVALRDREAAEQALADHSADIALVYEPNRLADFHTLITVPQPVCVVMAIDHPLTVKSTLRLRDCLPYPIGLPTKQFGVRQLIDLAQMRLSFKLNPVVESDSFEFLRNYPIAENLLSFQIPIGLPAPDELNHSRVCYRPLDSSDVPAGVLHLGQLRARTLPIAAARFAEQVAQALAGRFGAIET